MGRVARPAASAPICRWLHRQARRWRRRIHHLHPAGRAGLLRARRVKAKREVDPQAFRLQLFHKRPWSRRRASACTLATRRRHLAGISERDGSSTGAVQHKTMAKDGRASGPGRAKGAFRCGMFTMHHRSPATNAEVGALLVRRRQLCSSVDALDRLLHPDLSFVAPSGDVYTKTDDLDWHRIGWLRVHSLEPEDFIVVWRRHVTPAARRSPWPPMSARSSSR